VDREFYDYPREYPPFRGRPIAPPPPREYSRRLVPPEFRERFPEREYPPDFYGPPGPINDRPYSPYRRMPPPPPPPPPFRPVPPPPMNERPYSPYRERRLPPPPPPADFAPTLPDFNPKTFYDYPLTGYGSTVERIPWSYRRTYPDAPLSARTYTAPTYSSTVYTGPSSVTRILPQAETFGPSYLSSGYTIPSSGTVTFPASKPPYPPSFAGELYSSTSGNSSFLPSESYVSPALRTGVITASSAPQPFTTESYSYSTTCGTDLMKLMREQHPHLFNEDGTIKEGQSFVQAMTQEGLPVPSSLNQPAEQPLSQLQQQIHQPQQETVSAMIATEVPAPPPPAGSQPGFDLEASRLMAQ
jgi:hypothetical protein